MRRPNFKWIVKSMLSVVISLTLFLLITSWISMSPYTNKPVHHVMPQPKAQHLQPAMRPIEPIGSLDGDPVNVVAAPHNPGPLKVPKQQIVEDEPKAQLVPPNDLKKDWHDYVAMELDAKRVGIGEEGKAAKLDGSQRELERKLSLENGFNALLSDSISVNRSVPDIRHKDCRKKLYLEKLPTVSVIIIFYNEYLSVLLRSVHSLINRSPRELLKEIILVDDYSDRDYLFGPLEKYIAENFSNVKIVRLTKRTGLIGARSAGAREAKADVLIFLDSHVEANYNWLPPLIEPIAINKRTAVCPFIDVIAHKDFTYRAQDEGARGAFDWQFYYKRLPLLPEEMARPTEPFKSPVMAGGLFAISREFFWELGGYDEGLDIWGGEQYELSFKIWMCGGEMYDAPCSRIAHIYRGPRNSQKTPRTGDYLHRNYKRVAEVWMDEYKNYLYEHAHGIYESIDAGDLTQQKAIRKKLKCKSFKWFMEEVAFDLVKSYPPIEPPNYAFGALQSVGEPSFCVDTLNHGHHSKIGLYPCASNLKRPQSNQFWSLSWRRDLRLIHGRDCLDVQQWEANASVWLWECHGQGGNQLWYYDYKTNQLQHGAERKRCLEALPFERELVVNKCRDDNQYMKWNFGNVNTTALDNFFANY